MPNDTGGAVHASVLGDLKNDKNSSFNRGFDDGWWGLMAPRSDDDYDSWLSRIEQRAATGDASMWADTPTGGPAAGRLKEYVNLVRANRSKYEKLFAPKAGEQTDPRSPGNNPYEQEAANFYRLMMDPNAPELKQAMTSGMNRGSTDSANRGIAGGLSQAGILKAGLDSRGGLAQQRAGLGLQALQAGMTYNNNVANMGLQAKQQQQQHNQYLAGLENQARLAGQASNDSYLKAGVSLFGQAAGAAGSYGSYQPSGSGIGVAQPDGPPSSPSEWNNPY